MTQVISRVVLALLLSCNICSAKIMYVDVDATGTNNGSSWENAYVYLQDALADANSSKKPVEIRVAQGIYKPDMGANQTPGDREATFQLINGVTLAGGYAGIGESAPNARDIELHETILSGDLNDDDRADLANNDENSYHVVTANRIDDTTVIEGFVVTAGNANGSYGDSNGGGMYNFQSSPIVTNCTFSWNSAYYDGGGMYNYSDAKPTVVNCTFNGNVALVGAGMFNRASAPVLSCCTLRDNRVFERGGGMYNLESNPDVTNCTFSRNWAIDGGGMYNLFGSNPTVVNCTFNENCASFRGGGIYNLSSTPTLTNCIFWGNCDGGGINESAQIDGDTTVINNSCVQGWTGKLAGTGNIGEDPLLTPDAHLKGGSSCIDRCPSGSIYDRDGDERPVDIAEVGYDDATDPCVFDMGSDEFQDTDGDGLPDWWENKYFGSNTAAAPAADPDMDGRSNLIEYEQFSTSPIGPRRIHYVDTDATGAYDGSSWANAYKYLQDALAASTRGDEIWVAEGIYRPDVSATNPGGTGNREKAFVLINGIAIYGGFAGTEMGLEQRDWQAHETILSGDLDENDINVADPCNLLNEPTRAENSYHVVIGSRTDNSAVLDGFVISGGNANRSYYLDHSGGGIYSSGGSPMLLNCKFTMNSAHEGGGMGSHWHSGATLINCTFLTNAAGPVFGYGGGMSNRENSRPRLDNCDFVANWSTQFGGAIFNREYGNPILTNCIFNDNYSSALGGGVYNYASGPILTKCTFSGNRSSQGGGMYSSHARSMLVNCTFSGNSAKDIGGGVLSYASTPELKNCTFCCNSAPSLGGGLHSNDSDPNITDCVFTGNSARIGAAMANGFMSSAVLTNCTFNRNSAKQHAGGIYNFHQSHLMLTNSTFTKNSAEYGGALYNAGSDANVSNCIFWQDTANNGQEVALAPYAQPLSTLTISYSDVQGGSQEAYVEPDCALIWGAGNINIDPLFANLDNGDYHLKSEAGRWTSASSIEPDPNSGSWVLDDVTSPCIDAGDPNDPVGGEPEPNGGRINMGAYGGTAEASKSYVEE